MPFSACPSSEKDDEKCILRKSDFHQILPKHRPLFILFVIFNLNPCLHIPYITLGGDGKNCAFMNTESITMYGVTYYLSCKIKIATHLRCTLFICICVIFM